MMQHVNRFAFAGLGIICLMLSQVVIGAERLPYIAGELLIKYKSDISAKQRSKGRIASKIRQRTHFPSFDIEHWILPKGESVQAAIAELAKDPGVEFVEPNYRRYPYTQHGVPNEGVLDGGTDLYEAQRAIFTQINLEKLWEQKKDARDVKLAVIDNAFELDHEDLRDNIIAQKDFVDNDSDLSPGTDCDGDNARGHGTTVVGVVGARTNNNVGIAGAAWNVGVVALRIGCDYAVDTELKAFQYAIDEGVDIINVSYGGPEFSVFERSAVSRLASTGILLVAAAGNHQVDNDKIRDYPSGLDLPNIISVAATDETRQLERRSQYGQISVDIAAPGTSIWTTILGNQYGKADFGTSYSAPLVAGVAALLKSAYPLSDFSDLKGAILGGARSIPDTKARLATDGELDALKAYELMLNPVPVIVIKNITIDDSLSSKKNGRLDDGETVTMEIELENIWNTVDSISTTLSSVAISQPLYANASTLSEGDTVSLSFDIGKIDFVQDGYHRLPFSLSIDWDMGGETGKINRYFEVDAGALKRGIEQKSKIATHKQDDMHLYHINVPTSATGLMVELKIEDQFVNLDLLVKRGSIPQFDHYPDEKGEIEIEDGVLSASEDGDDTITIDTPTAGTYYISVYVPSGVDRPDIAYSIKTSYKLPRAAGCSCSVSQDVVFDPVFILMLGFSLLYLSRSKGFNLGKKPTI